MRTNILGGFALLLGLSLAACAAPTLDEDVGEAEGAAAEASALGGSLSSEEVAALHGEGLRDCSESVGAAVLCTYPGGFAVVSESGIALVEAKGDFLVGKALSNEPTRNDVSDVLSAADDEPSEDLASRSLRPLTFGMSATLIEMVAAKAYRALSSAPSKAAVRAGAEEAQVVATRNPALASEVSKVTSSAAQAGARNVSTFGGTTCLDVAGRIKTWAASQKKRVVALGSDTLESGDPEVMRIPLLRLEELLRTQKAEAAREGLQLSLFMPSSHTSNDAIRALAKRLDVDVLQLGGEKARTGVVAHATPDTLPSYIGAKDLKPFPHRYVMTEKGVEVLDGVRP